MPPVGSEGLDPGPHLDLPGPGVARLTDEVKIALRDRIRIEHGATPLRIGPARGTNAAVDDHVPDMHAVRMQLARHGLCETSKSEFPHGEGCGARIALDAGGRAGEQDRAL